MSIWLKLIKCMNKNSNSGDFQTMKSIADFLCAHTYQIHIIQLYIIHIKNTCTCKIHRVKNLVIKHPLNQKKMTKIKHVNKTAVLF